MPPPPPPLLAVHTIDEVVDWAGSASSRLGYFAALYKRITLAVDVADGARLRDLQRDYDTINAVLASQVAGVIADINEISPALATSMRSCAITRSSSSTRPFARCATAPGGSPPCSLRLRTEL